MQVPSLRELVLKGRALKGASAELDTLMAEALPLCVVWTEE